MSGKIILSNSEYEIYNYSIDQVPVYGYCITINTNLDKSFKDIITGENDLNDSINYSIEYLKSNDLQFSKEEIEFYEQIRKKQKEILIEAEYVEFYFDIESIVKYLKENEELKTKKIIINEDCNLSYENLKKYESILGEFSENIYFELYSNKNLISFKECIETYKILDETAKEIESLNFSPIEKIMYIYDIVRNKIYNKESKDEEDTVSRDLSSCLLGDKIVCLGYARIFNALLEKVGINSKEIYLYNEISGHARNEIYIKDDKYNINGVYYFDTTWDSKRNESDKKYLSSYKFFAMTKKQMDEIDSGKMIQKNFPYFDENMAWEIEEIINESGIESIPNDMVKSINHMANIIDTKYVISMITTFHNQSHLYGKKNSKEISNEIMELVNYFNKKLSAETLLKILYNVRKKQYYSNPDKYPFSINEFYKTVLISDWEFKENAEIDLLDAIFGTNRKKSKKDQIINYNRKTDLFKSIEQVRLTKTLRRIHEEKKKD